MKRCAVILMYSLLQISSAVSQNIILPDNKNILYSGRLDFSNPLVPKISWAGTQIQANFQGTSLKVIFKGRNNTYYNVFIDGKSSVLSLDSGKITYSLANNLKDTVHNLILLKRDSPWNPQQFYGLILDDGKSLITPPGKFNKKIEFYGDSKTQGAQADVIPAEGPDLGPIIYDNNYNSYAAIIARHFNADYSCIARNGLSLTPYKVRDNLPDYFDRSGMGKNYKKWDFSKWQPDIVCINLGANDRPYPKDFVKRYVRFIQKLRKPYPQSKIFILSGPFWNDSILSNAGDEVRTTLNNLGDKNVYHHIFKTRVKNEGHPRAATHKACADELIDVFSKKDW